MYKTIKIKPIEIELKDYKEPLVLGNKDVGIITHLAKIPYLVYKEKNMKRFGCKWSEDFKEEIVEETDKAILIAPTYRDRAEYEYIWIPKKWIDKVIKIIEIEED